MSSGTLTVVGPDGTEEQHPLYLSSPSVIARYLYSGSLDDMDLATLLAGGGAEVTVYANSETSINRPSGTLNTTSVPEPGRMALLMLGMVLLVLGRRRALGGCQALARVAMNVPPKAPGQGTSCSLIG